jgi:membrane protein YdbS with pleckstrin-like domain
MRWLQHQPLARLVLALVLAAVSSLGVGTVSSPPAAVLAFVVVTILAFVAVTIAPDSIALQRRHYWRWWWRTSEDDGPFWPGTRIPRGPRRPR